MNKLKLDLDALRVDSFGTSGAAAAAERGTVQGQAAPLGASKVSCGGWTDPCLCDPCHSCGGATCLC